MTTPPRSTIAEPGQFPDPEALFADLLGQVEVGGTTIGSAQVDTDASGLTAPSFQAYVPPGRRQVSRYGDMDTAFVYLGAWGTDRDQAQQMQRSARELLAGFRDGGLHRGVQVYRIRESAGPAEIPQRPDAPDRLVEGGWTTMLRRHRGAAVLG